jgi:hypothetical protein
MGILNGIMPALRLLAAVIAIALGATIIGLTAAVVVASALTLAAALALVFPARRSALHERTPKRTLPSSTNFRSHSRSSELGHCSTIRSIW